MLLDFLFRLFHPSYWIMINQYNHKLDSWVINALKNPEFKNIGDYCCTFNGIEFWIGNRPYGVCFNNKNMRPSCRTISKFLDALDDEILKGLK